MCTLLISAWRLREIRSARILLTVEGQAHPIKKKGANSHIDLTVEITNVERIATTVTDVFWSISNKAGGQEEGTKEAASNADVRYTLGATELPVVLGPNSSHRNLWQGTLFPRRLTNLHAYHGDGKPTKI